MPWCLMKIPVLREMPLKSIQWLHDFDWGFIPQILSKPRVTWATDSYWSLTHWVQVTHICVSKLTIIASDNGLSPGRRQAIIWTNAGTLLIGPLGIKFNEILIEIHTFSFKKIHLKMPSVKQRPFCLGPNVLSCGGVIHAAIIQFVCGKLYYL